KANLSAETDWTCRALAAGLKPRRVYWYRFTDEHGFGSRIGRTVTAPSEKDSRPVRFAFVSCQNVQQGASTAYRRMIWADERRAGDERLGFVLPLGDFVYEVVWYPEDRPQGYYARRLRDIVRYTRGEKIRDFHVPATVGDYRALYQAYLSDPDLQDARARWPFVCMWDNHEFSWKGWQSQQNFVGVRPAQTRKVAANQAWFEYRAARVVKPGASPFARFEAPAVADAPIRDFDDHFSLMHGVRASLALQKTGDTRRALAERNPEVATHLSFVDVGGHGYSVARTTADELEVAFGCIPRPLERGDRADGGPLSYRVAHRVKRWSHDVAPRLERTALEGTLPLIF